MKTKNLLFAMALPVAFAACSSEEFETLQNGQVDLGARKALGDVTLVFNGAEANTRLEIGQGGIGFSREDGVGACLVDAPNGNWSNPNKAAIEKYGLTNYISTNYLYKTVDGGATWTTEARMVEGNYVFYAPQNESHLVRSSIEAELPNPQVIKLKDGAPDQYSAIQQLIDAKTPMYIGYKFLDAATQTNDISVSMKPIYAYPKITLKNSFGVGTGTPAATSATKDLKISRVVIKSSGIAQKTSLTIGTANAQASKNASGVVGNLFNYGTNSAKYGKWETSAKLFGCASADVLTTASQGTTNAVRLDFEEPYVLGKDQSISFNAVLPAKAYTDIVIGVYTDQGYFESGTNITATLIPGQMYPQQEYMENGSLNQNVKGKTLTEELVTPSGVTGEIVATTAELEALVKSGQGNLLVTPLNSDVEYNATVAGYMLQGGVQSIQFTDAVTVNGANVTKKLVFDGDVIIKGSVVFGNSNITWGSNTVNISEGATLTVSDFDAATAPATGEIVPAEGATLILNNAAKVPAIDTDAEGKVKVNANLTLPAAFTEYAGEIEVVSGKTMKLAADFTNKGTLTNNGTIALNGFALTNEGTVENKNLIKDAAATITNKGTFNNEKIVDAAFTNAGSYTDADNYTVATLNVKSGAIMNKAVSNATTGDSDNDKLVNVINVASGCYFNNNASAIVNGTVQYTIDGNVTADPAVPAVCNTLVINGNVTASSAAIATTFDGELTVNGDVQAIGKAITFNNETAVTVTGQIYASGAAVTLASATEVSVGSIESDDDITLTVATATTVNGNVAIAAGKKVLFSAGGAVLNVNANCMVSGGGTISFAGTSASSEVKIAKNKTLTIMASTLTGNATKKLTITSLTGTGSDVRGKVVNYGTVSNASAAYTEGSTYPWWEGNAATI